ncbi:hypothetical protein BCV72DRAFT_324226 [Rhizopus microsporus var. microsporus]|uniref:Uncharacterized protein n=2 Tax=Rhizopus microsporus TaxID=58291 RepID=A0A2G4SJ19_RHIZD|nr:uncharacterized protein RHIMIDRAFT_247804 [Rhizopus microsporus ATCC 52813]ORE08348.1 hypothetical protein BCV72DRAFT_324226 [Rhizopus microsporus var. microsporus]PHZ08396.1 hypothetical protein RHIMIDRAFT_247804 [Rhizopus microsporus ATCC 52813]
MPPSLFQAKQLLLVHLALLLQIKILNAFMFLPNAISQLDNYVADYNACHFNSSHVLDIHYPDCHLAGFLAHSDHESDPRSQLNRFAITVRDEYDSRDPANFCVLC